MPAERKKLRKPIERRSVLDARKKETMLMVLIRNQSAFETVKATLSPKHVRYMGEIYAILWRVTQAFFDLHQRLPTKDILMDELQNAISAIPDDVDPSEINEIEAFIEGAFDDAMHGTDISQSKLHRDHAVETARLFLDEVLASDLAQNITSGSTVVADLPDLLKNMYNEAETHSVIVSGSEMDELLFPPGWDTQQRTPLISTGISLLDLFLGGGHKPPEVNIFLGPYGSCKTSVAIMGACNAALMAKRAYCSGETDSKIPKVIFVSTEILEKEFRERALSCLSQVPRYRLAQMRSLESLDHSTVPASTPETAYENRFFSHIVANGGRFFSEFERVSNASMLLNDFMIFVNFTGSNEKRHNAGYGGILEMSTMLKGRLHRHENDYVYVMWLDHAAALASRILEGRKGNTSDSDRRHILRDIPLQCRDYIAVPHNCPVWVTHQLSGAANDKSPVADLSHTDGDECKSIAMYADFAVVTGASTQDDEQLCRWRCTKHRREPPRRHAIAQVDGVFARILDVSSNYVVDTSTKRIITRQEAIEMCIISPDTQDVDMASGETTGSALRPSRRRAQNYSRTVLNNVGG